jgi:hypothetical protein
MSDFSIASVFEGAEVSADYLQGLKVFKNLLETCHLLEITTDCKKALMK